MRYGSVITIYAVLLSASVGASEPPPKAPAPGSPANYLSADQLATVMKSALAAGADPALSQIANNDQYFINKIHRTRPAPAYAHAGWTEVHIILEGSGTVTTGGTLKTVGEVKSIEGGTSRKVAKGDIIIVPADTPHQYTAIDGSLDAIEVRFIAPTAVSR